MDVQDRNSNVKDIEYAFREDNRESIGAEGEIERMRDHISVLEDKVGLLIGMLGLTEDQLGQLIGYQWEKVE